MDITLYTSHLQHSSHALGLPESPGPGTYCVLVRTFKSLKDLGAEEVDVCKGSITPGPAWTRVASAGENESKRWFHCHLLCAKTGAAPGMRLVRNTTHTWQLTCELRNTSICLITLNFKYEMRIGPAARHPVTISP